MPSIIVNPLILNAFHAVINHAGGCEAPSSLRQFMPARS